MSSSMPILFVNDNSATEIILVSEEDEILNLALSKEYQNITQILLNLNPA